MILHMCTKNHNIWCTVPEIWSEIDRIFYHYGPFFALLLPPVPPAPQLPNDLQNQNFEKNLKKCLDILSFCTISEDHRIYGSWGATDRNFRHFGPFFSFQPLENLKNQNFNMKKTPGDIIISHIRTTIDNHMMNGSWDMGHNRHIFLSFWTIFCPFSPLWTQKIKILKKWKKHLKILAIILQMPTINDSHIMYGSWDEECNEQNFCHFGLFFALLFP